MDGRGKGAFGLDGGFDGCFELGAQGSQRNGGDGEQGGNGKSGGGGIVLGDR